MNARIGEILLRQGLITNDQLNFALAYQIEHGGKLGSCMTKLGMVNEDAIIGVLSQHYGVPSIRLRHFEPDPEVVKLVPRGTALRYHILPLSRVNSTITIAMADPTDVYAVDDIRFMTGLHVEPLVAPEASIVDAIQRFYGEPESVDPLDEMLKGLTGSEEALEIEAEEQEINVTRLEQAAEEAPLVKLVNLILIEAMKREASDIHVEPYEKELRVRYRIDGVLQTIMTPPLRLKDSMTNRLKIMARLDISEKRLPQDGRMVVKYTQAGHAKELDFRVSTVPTLFGEKVVLRLLDKENLRLDMTKLGFEPESLEKFQRNILKPYGMVLVTGPTGSGKTNTLYSAVSRLNVPGTNIMTAEDPVEFHLTGINQVQVKEQIGLTFATALRSFLRQDPNIILVGEIRDFETAEIAVKAAMTGHLVLSTLHTNDAPSTVTRLINMGMEPFLVATSLNLVVAQRLVRRICGECRQKVEISKLVLLEGGFTEEEAHLVELGRGAGCKACAQTGYRGRVGLYEVMEMTDPLRELVLAGASVMDIRRAALEQGMITLRRSGLTKVGLGQTTLDEVLRETVL